MVANKRLSVRKVNGAENPADLFTKYLFAAEMCNHVDFMHMSFENGRSMGVPLI